MNSTSRWFHYTDILTFRHLIYIYMNFFACHHMSLMDFEVFPPDFGRSVTDFWGWEAHEAQLRCPDGANGDM
jgi:hypothetical protein